MGQQRFLRLYAHERFDHFAIFHDEDGGDAAYAELDRQTGILVHINLRHHHIVRQVGCRFIQNGCEHLAGTAPGRPEIQQTDFSRRFFFKIRFRQVFEW